MNSGRSQTDIQVLIFVIFSCFFWFGAHPLLSAERKPDEDVFSIRADNEPLREVLKKIAKASDYEIRFNTKLANERVSIQLDNVTLNEALARVLRPYDHFSFWDDTNYTITLIIFKKNSPPVTISGVKRIFELATETTAGP